MSLYTVQDSELTSIANTIRTKGGTSAPLVFPGDFVTAINDISGMPSFVGSFNFAADGGQIPKIELNTSTVNYANADSMYRAIRVKNIQYNQLSSWEICCKFSDYAYGLGSGEACFIGTSGNSYWDNPSVECGGQYVWLGCTTSSGSTWTTSVVVNLSEVFDTTKQYTVKIGWNGTKLYCIVRNLSSDTIIGLYEKTTATNPHLRTGYPLGFGFNALAYSSRYNFKGKIHLIGTYVKENGVLTWGTEG